MGVPGFAEYTMVPSGFHAPPAAARACASGCTSPPSISTRFSMSLVKNPIDRLSGDQNGWKAPSVPASGLICPGVQGAQP